jgi:hypothetical protein
LTIDADEEFVCVIKMTRPPSVRELANIMSMGVRVYRSIPHYSYIARANSSQILHLADLPFTEWVDELRPEQKYAPDKVWDPTWGILVYCLEETTGHERELEALGADIVGAGSDGYHQHRWRFYAVRVDPAKVYEIARLWWVQWIWQPMKPAPDAQSLLGPSRVNIEEYMKLPDPEEAGRLLLEEAQLAGVDVDKVWEGPRLGTIRLGVGSTPVPKSSELLTRSRELLAAGDSSPEMICMVKMYRYPTYRALAAIMSDGIRIYRSIPHYSYIVRASADDVVHLSNNPLVEWIGELRPDQKYPQDQTWDSEWAIVSPDKIDEIARLWWVQWLWQSPRPKLESAPVQKSSLPGTSSDLLALCAAKHPSMQRER